MFGVYVCWSVTFVLMHRGTEEECLSIQRHMIDNGSCDPDHVRVSPIS